MGELLSSTLYAWSFSYGKVCEGSGKQIAGNLD